jgi:hypothetical protein
MISTEFSSLATQNTRHVACEPFAATTALNSSYQTDRWHSRPALASRWAASPQRRARTKICRRPLLLFPAAAKVGKVDYRRIVCPMDAHAKTTFDFDFIHSTRYNLPPFKLALVQQCALIENSPRPSARRLLDCFAPGSALPGIDPPRVPLRVLLRTIQV